MSHYGFLAGDEMTEYAKIVAVAEDNEDKILALPSSFFFTLHKKLELNPNGRPGQHWDEVVEFLTATGDLDSNIKFEEYDVSSYRFFLGVRTTDSGRC